MRAFASSALWFPRQTYGTVLTTAGLLVQAGVINSSSKPDWRALDWHAYLWDPWFLIWGLLIAAALARSRAGHAAAATLGRAPLAVRAGEC
jgi:hypothetical protein